MNIFTVLNKGNSSLREVSMSAVLAYFLDPKEDHGLGSTFLNAFLGLSGEGVADVLESPNLSLYNSIVELEKPLVGKLAVDIEIVLFGNDEDPVHRLLIENKIRPDSVCKGQLSKYYKAAKDEKDEYKNIATTVAFLTPSGGNHRLKEEYDSLDINQGDHKTRVYWASKSSSIQGVIQNEILQPESLGKITPICDYVKHTLKAFAMHLNSIDSSSKPTSSANASNVGEKIVHACGYEIAKNRMGRVSVRKDGDKVIAKPALRDINNKMKLGIEENPGGINLTTRQLGARIIQALEQKERSDDS